MRRGDSVNHIQLRVLLKHTRVDLPERHRILAELKPYDLVASPLVAWERENMASALFLKLCKQCIARAAQRELRVPSARCIRFDRVTIAALHDRAEIGRVFTTRPDSHH